MAKLVSLLISARRQRVIELVLGVATFLVLVSLAAFLGVEHVKDTMRLEERELLRPYEQISRNLRSTFAAIGRQVTAAPCSPAFHRQFQRVAYLPDGFNEFVYAPGGVIRCTAHAPTLAQPVDLGPPDVERVTAHFTSRMWIDSYLKTGGLDGLIGTIVLHDDIGIVVPRETENVSPPDWMRWETSFIGTAGQTWHRGGQLGVVRRGRAPGAGLRMSDLTIRDVTCIEGDYVCAGMAASPLAVVLAHKPHVAGALVLAALLSICLAGRGRALIVRYWSLEARFRRHLDADSVVCAYQPILDVTTGRVAACEVLARWRDVDDTIVYPDRFIPLVERHGLTLAFTRMVVRRAFAELSQATPVDHPLAVTFNIFPRDLDCTALQEIFEPFLAMPERFSVIIELVESDAVDVDEAQRQIQALRAVGVRTYIDDFGSGYSNIQNLAALSVDGVKLDRSFAMAPDDSLMARMLVLAIEMIHTSGRVIVVEGIETEARLDMLRQVQPPVDFVQGYHISRPLDIARFVQFLEKRRAEDRLRLAA
ncbi:EAL domain-containing protein [Jiella sp. M17.18]|uniref:EAL domain-containing protein n=1 Tax=Jiella sp. M17.18 TaxID=3234247 RepID=UPI0034DE0D30